MAQTIWRHMAPYGFQPYGFSQEAKNGVIWLWPNGYSHMAPCGSKCLPAIWLQPRSKKWLHMASGQMATAIWHHVAPNGFQPYGFSHEAPNGYIWLLAKWLQPYVDMWLHTAFSQMAPYGSKWLSSQAPKAPQNGICPSAWRAICSALCAPLVRQ